MIKKIIAVIPTWRAYLLTGWGLKPISDERFVSSEYFKFYKELFSDERLREALAEHGYEMRMKPHYRMTPYMHLFKEYGIEVFDGTLGYSEILSESALLLTDYSSVAFDFAYLRKAMIYAQFDRDDFFSGSHSYVKGYFDYDANGFGEVTEDVGSTVSAIIGCIEQNCKPSKKYLSRIDGFFAFSDKSNTERVVERLLDL